MSLHVYRRVEDLPKGMKYVKENDTYFNMRGSLDKDDILQVNILRDIEKAEIISDKTVKGENYDILGSTGLKDLSTGTKTLLNINSNPDICFDTIECGDNVLEYLRHFNKGNIIWKEPVLLLSDTDYSCDIEYKGIIFNSYPEFLMFVENEGINYGFMCK